LRIISAGTVLHAEALHRAKEEEDQNCKCNEEDPNILIFSEEKGCRSFRDGALNLCALEDDILVVDPFLLFDQVVAVAVLVCGRGSVALRSEFHARDKKPLHE